MFFPFKPNFGFTPQLKKRDILALIFVIMIWAFAIWSVLNDPVVEVEQKAKNERNMPSAK